MPVFKVVTRYSVPYQGHIPEKKYHDSQAVNTVIRYVLDAGKTNAELCGGFAVNPAMAAD